MEVRLAGLESNRHLIRGDGLIESPLRGKNQALVIVGFRIIVPEFQRPAVHGQGFHQPPLLLHGVAEIVVRLWIVGL